MFVVDANVLVYAADAEVAEHARCRQLLEQWRAQSGAWYLTWGICHEFLSVMTHRRGPRPVSSLQAHGFLEALFASGGLQMLSAGDRYRAVLGDIVRDVPALAGKLWHDVETAALMREHGIRRIVTRDTVFHRFRFLEVVDPLVAEP